MDSTILIVSHEPTLCASLRHRLEQGGHGVSEAESASSALARFDRADVVFIAGTVPDKSALELTRSLAEIDPSLPVIVLAPDPETRLEALRSGAFQSLTMPADLEEVALLAQRALENRRMRQRLDQRAMRERTDHTVGGILGQSAAIQEVRARVGEAARQASSVLITGEPGTGKQFVARVIHAQSKEAAGPFVVITPSELAEDRALTENGGGPDRTSRIRRADGGTLVLKDIAEASQTVQDRLWHFLATRASQPGRGSFDARIVATSRRDLMGLVRDGRFRQDLASRLAAQTIFLPPIRQRQEDIEPLVQHFAEHYARVLDKPFKGVTQPARRRLSEHNWAANVREIKNTVERAVLRAGEPLLDADDFDLIASSSDPAHFELPAGGINLRAVEQDLVVQALRLSGGNQTRAAQLLGMNRDQIRYRIAKFHLDRASMSVHPSSRPSAN